MNARTIIDFGRSEILKLANSKGMLYRIRGWQGFGIWQESIPMVRRTLEEICADRGAKGKDLKARINDLRIKTRKILVTFYRIFMRYSTLYY